MSEIYSQRAQVEGVVAQYAALLLDPETIDAIQRDKALVPADADRESYFGDQHLSYWLSGRADLFMVRRLVPDASFAHVLDFGGATGRFARHIPLVDPSAKVTIADLNVNHIEWVEQNLNSAISGIKVSPYPYFPLADASVSLCVGLSVFTHIDSYESGWLADIHRVLIPGGYAVLTIHSEQSWPLLGRTSWLLDVLLRDAEFAAAYREGEPMPAGRRVYASDKNSIEHNCQVFMDEQYVRSRWGKRFEVVEISHRAHHDFQAAVVLRKSL